MISYKFDLKGIDSSMLEGFFVDWPNHPSPEKHFEIMQNSSYIVLAVETDSKKVIGFINAVSDKVLSAYIPLLEVLPEYQGRGIGKELTRRMLEVLKDFYMIDICCDENLQTFYEKFGLKKYSSMILRNYSKQGGK